MGEMTIGELAQKSGIGVETIRFCERGAEDLGFSLKEIAELLALRRHPGDSCRAVRERAGAKEAAAEIPKSVKPKGRIA